MSNDEQWWPNQQWKLEGFRANPELRDGFLHLHNELGQIIKDAEGKEFVPVDVRTLTTVYYALLSQIQLSNQAILLEIQDLRNDLEKSKR